MISPQLNGMTVEEIQMCWDISEEIIALASGLQLKEVPEK